jgi:hypothetical protein
MNSVALRATSADLMAEQGNRRILLRFSTYEKLLALVFLLTLPLSNPWVRGDGVGYYAFARSVLFEHRLDFTEDWQKANSTFREGRIDAGGHIRPEQYTSTGELDNHFSVGPAMLWAPFLLATSAVVHFYKALGGKVANDGYAQPYLISMAIGTALYGFLGIWISFRIARKYCGEEWAFLAAVGVWFASSLPVYMYFNPSWSHAQSAFAVALFIWYWDRTREARNVWQWLVLGGLAGLMTDVYYPNLILCVLPGLESLGVYSSAFRGQISKGSLRQVIFGNAVFLLTALAALLPTLIAKKIIYGSFLASGYYVEWFPWSPAFFKVCFSSDHGLFSWTPVALLGVLGLALLYRKDRIFSLYALVACGGYIYFLGCYSDWDGVASFGNRFCVSLTPLFILGMAALLRTAEEVFQTTKMFSVAAAMAVMLILWNLGLIFQWGVHLVPARGPISWRDTAYNQFAVVPEQTIATVRNYMTRRKELMNDIEERDARTLRSRQGDE